jgi:hypothetical protein
MGKIKEKVKVVCKVCKKEEYVNLSRSKYYVTCSLKCMGSNFQKPRIPNCFCKNCNKHIYKKPSKKVSKLGDFCSMKCLSEYQKIAFLAQNNPNYKGIIRNTDGYKMLHIPNMGSMKHHNFTMYSILGIKKVPKGYNLHHRDCNRDNNLPDNLCLINRSDHMWIHKQFGSAVLWAYSKNQIDLDTLIKWSNDQERAKRLLPLTLEQQIGIFKQEELLEHPTLERQKEDNQQPSLNSNIFEGSTTNSQILTNNVEDSNADTSILPCINTSDDIV